MIWLNVLTLIGIAFVAGMHTALYMIERRFASLVCVVVCILFAILNAFIILKAVN